MTTLRVWLARLAGLFRRPAGDRALDDEIRAHLDDLTDELAERGMSRAEAVREARRQFGGVDRIKEAYRDQRGWPSLDWARQDLVFAWRQLWTQRASALLAVLCLGLGIGVSMAFFTIVNAHCLRGLPIAQADRVFFLATRDRDGDAAGLSYAEFSAIRSDAAGFSGVAAYTTASFNAADDVNVPERLAGSYISAGGFGVLGIAPILGREFAPEDETPGAPAVAIIGHHVWASRYGRDPSTIGRTVRINGTSSTIVGVMPAGFRFPGHANAWLPLAAMPGLSIDATSTRNLAAFGRIDDDATNTGVADALTIVAQRLAGMSPVTNRDILFSAVPINERFNGRITQPEWRAFLTAGLLVLLVACANVANLLIARVAVRSREVALRLAMGATRLRIVRQLLVESLVLAFVSGAVGLVFAIAAVRLLAWTVPASAPLPYWIVYAVDGRVLAALLATCMTSVVIFGMVPAVHGTKVSVNGLLKDGGRHGTATRRTRRLSGTFMAVQVALAIVLLTNVSMDLQREFGPAEPGFAIDPDPLLTAQIALPPTRYASPEDRQRFFDQLDERVRRADGVTSMTLMNELPPAGGAPMRLRLPDQALAASEEGDRVFAAAIGPGYFETLGVPLTAGRDLTSSDSLPGREGVVVSQHFATRTFPGRAAVGTRIGLIDERSADGEPVWRTIVGVAPDLRHGPSPRAVVYLPNHGNPPASAVLIVRATGHLDVIGPRIRQAVAALDADLPVHRAVPLRTARHESSWIGRVSSGMLRGISSIALLLAMVGLYAVTAHGVAQRTQEIGIRVALGATPGFVTRLVLRRALAYVGIGLALGVPAAHAFGRMFNTPTAPSLASPMNLLPVAGLVVVIAIVACARPAMRASRIEPARTLRSD